LPESHRAQAGIERDVVLIGLVDRVELWSKPAWKAFEADSAADFDSLDRVLSGPERAAPEGLPTGHGRKAEEMLLGVEMSTRDPRSTDFDPAPVHVPVLADELVQLLAGSAQALERGWIVDLTVGAGGHAARLLEALPGAALLGLDQDPEVLAHARERLAPFGPRARVRRSRMSFADDAVYREGIDRVIAVVIDLGVSSLQLDSAERGFSFQQDGPLDMRMDPDRVRTAADVVNRWDESDLADLFYYEGGETRARRVARAIVESRRRAPFRRTLPLAELIERTLGRRGHLHPATRVFQALRRVVNQESEELAAGIEFADRWLVDGGRLAVIAFHSGEDGEVKRALARGAQEGRWKPLTKRPITPTREEIAANPRARSALLRGAERMRLEREAGKTHG
jgi:16S rRNA (cytosine1402-N4)-methyltransferase